MTKSTRKKLWLTLFLFSPLVDDSKEELKNMCNCLNGDKRQGMLKTYSAHLFYSFQLTLFPVYVAERV